MKFVSLSFCVTSSSILLSSLCSWFLHFSTHPSLLFFLYELTQQNVYYHVSVPFVSSVVLQVNLVAFQMFGLNLHESLFSSSMMRNQYSFFSKKLYDPSTLSGIRDSRSLTQGLLSPPIDKGISLELVWSFS